MEITNFLPEIVVVAVRSRGPGGQNVNKVSSAAQLFWNYRASTALTAQQKHLIGVRLKNMINSEGEIFLRCDEYRDLPRNKARALEKLGDLLTHALHVAKPRKATRPSAGSKIRKKQGKIRHAQIKSARKKVSWE